MNGDDLLAEISRRVMARRNTKTISDSVLATELGVTQPGLQGYRGKELTPKQVANLIDKAAKKATDQFASAAICPIVEFLPIYAAPSSRSRNQQIFSTLDDNDQPHPFWTGLRKELEQSHGIYVFHDSRGRAIYTGKAHRLSLWAEINNAFNRDRGEVQSIKRVSHPSTRKQFKGTEEVKRRIAKQEVPLHHLASYMSAYAVPESLIGKLEALLVRAFANDLLNVRMENF